MELFYRVHYILETDYRQIRKAT